MIEKRAPLENDEPKYKKKSKKKGQPRADHQHAYKTVCLINEYVNPYHAGDVSIVKRPTKVCTICGSVGETDMSRYEYVEIQDMPYEIHKRVIAEEESLEKWYIDEYFDKFAHKRNL